MGTESSTTRERLVTAMHELMRRQGYAATSVKQVTVTAAATTGSLYHFFPEGKPALAAAALRESGAAYIQLLPLLLDPHQDLVEAVASAFDAAADQIEAADWINMCPVGTVAGEVGDTDPGLRAVAAEVVAGWVDSATDYFAARGLEASAARSFSLAVLSTLEGAFILSRTLRSTEPLRAAGRTLAASTPATASSGRRRPP
ncbi:TetR/AcrR family transcriptional regulator [Tsukamurella sp. 8F]|uniref:TetR/AcrR family transcriptional regulator n=1 Tax=unclassified Tsukamurella TaxID=2633480 RepID=UPI0023B97ECE|nr:MULTISPECIES: TetR/AcrR family transcriptional regulator [unclassified Tsukamurella]MDF0532076.1 TetR/AcrR family transcriptional regulator [Tsukamurella sp. 8J]MDF0589188.1 TetR/AcrR family transcriptional regulator [Tsukamurella sp. 8F]